MKLFWEELTILVSDIQIHGGDKHLRVIRIICFNLARGDIRIGIHGGRPHIDRIGVHDGGPGAVIMDNFYSSWDTRYFTTFLIEIWFLNAIDEIAVFGNIIT